MQSSLNVICEKSTRLCFGCIFLWPRRSCLRSDFCCLQGQNHENISGMDSNSAPLLLIEKESAVGGGFIRHSLTP